MRHILHLVLMAAAALPLAPAALAQTGFPFQDESLHYNVNWPSGLSLGEATFTAHHKGGAWDLAMTLDSGIPGFAIADKIRSSVTDNLCSLELERDISHGAKKTREKTTFDQTKGEATRTTVFPAGGGTSTFNIPACPRDTMAFLYFARRELGQGRVAPPQQVFFGAAYSVRMDYTGAQTLGNGPPGGSREGAEIGFQPRDILRARCGAHTAPDPGPLERGDFLDGTGALKCAWLSFPRCRRRAAGSRIIPKP
jgi:hypothetical protein